MNTSGVDRCGGFLPTEDYVRRFRELGGEIVTIGSDAHNLTSRKPNWDLVPQEIAEATGSFARELLGV